MHTVIHIMHIEKYSILWKGHYANIKFNIFSQVKIYIKRLYFKVAINFQVFVNVINTYNFNKRLPQTVRHPLYYHITFGGRLKIRPNKFIRMSTVTISTCVMV